MPGKRGRVEVVSSDESEEEIAQATEGEDAPTRTKRKTAGSRLRDSSFMKEEQMTADMKDSELYCYHCYYTLSTKPH